MRVMRGEDNAVVSMHELPLLQLVQKFEPKNSLTFFWVLNNNILEYAVHVLHFDIMPAQTCKTLLLALQRWVSQY